MNESEKKERADARKKRKRRQMFIGRMIIVILLFIILGLCAFLGKDMLEKKKLRDNREQAATSAESESTADTAGTESAAETETQAQKKEDDIMSQAELKAAQYDYDGAISLLQKDNAYVRNVHFQNAAEKFQKKKDKCVAWSPEQVTHIFYHSLIVDTSKAFDGDYKTDGYNQVMTTMDEFNKITQIMYDEGYVMVNLYDLADVDENGKMQAKQVYLPKGKTPFVLSQDDVSYYHYMDGDGCASKLVLDENGEVKNEYVDADGNVLVGDYDLVPLLDSFIKEHPDFSYHGRKGILAMTGYNGVLGYRTDSAYKTGENLQDDQKKFLEDHPDFDYDQDVKDATKVADAMKAEGWEFASHTWGHMNATERSAEDLKTDDEKWKANVAPILGDTDMIIFAFGADIGDWEGYSSDNPKFQYYKSAGYDYFCNVDSSQYFVQITDQYFRQGRRNLDGYRMYYNPDMLSDLFDVSEVWDSSRPTPVPEM